METSHNYARDRVLEDDAAETPFQGPQRKGGGRRKGGGAKKPAPQVVEVRPVAEPARMAPRHWGLILSVLVLVLLPLAGTIVYLWTFAQDQYASTAGFTVRQEETGSASDLLGGLARLTGGGGSTTDTDVLHEFIRSQEIVERVNQRVDLTAHYAQHWPHDPVFSIWPGASIEQQLWYWRRMVRVSYDQGSGLIEVQVRAFDAQTAQAIASAIVEESQAMINDLNETARRDTMRYAQEDLDAAVERLRTAREELTSFRVRTQILDPEADMQGRMGVLNNLQQQLAEALVDYDLLLQGTDEGDPRRRQARQRIEVIRDRISEERANFASQDATVVDTDYPSLMAEYEGLRVDREFAEETYRAALTALDSARSNAARQSIYLATYIRPTLPQSAGHPQRLTLAGLTGLFLIMIWSIGALIFYSLRDRG